MAQPIYANSSQFVVDGYTSLVFRDVGNNGLTYAVEDVTPISQALATAKKMKASDRPEMVPIAMQAFFDPALANPPVATTEQNGTYTHPLSVSGQTAATRVNLGFINQWAIGDTTQDNIMLVSLTWTWVGGVAPNYTAETTP